MRLFRWLPAPALVFVLGSCTPGPEALPYDSRLETAAVTVYWNEAQTTRAEAATIARQASRFLGAALEVLGKESAGRRIHITLNGEGRPPGQERKAPYMDTEGGWVHLFRYPPISGGEYPYHNGLGHELVH